MEFFLIFILTSPDPLPILADPAEAVEAFSPLKLYTAEGVV